MAAVALELIDDEPAAMVLQHGKEREAIGFLVCSTRINPLKHGRRTYGHQPSCQLGSGLGSVEHRPVADSRVDGHGPGVGCEAAAVFRQPGDTRHEHLKRRSLSHDRVALAALRNDVTPHSRQSLAVVGVYPPQHAERAHVIAACVHGRNHMRAQRGFDCLSLEVFQRVFGLGLKMNTCTFR